MSRYATEALALHLNIPRVLEAFDDALQDLRSPSGPIRVGPSHNCTVAVAPFPPTGDQEANARLIAASPDLYAALRDATDALDYVHAIDSVTPPECDPDDGLCGAQFCAQNGCLVRKIAVARAALAKAQGAQS